MASLRAFVAVELDPKLAPRVVAVQEQLARDGWRRVKWVKAHNLHFTLKFLGEVPVDNLEQIVGSIGRGLRGFSKFGVELTGIGAFPSVSRPRVVWIGVGQGKEELCTLAELVRGEFPPEKQPFRPHLTIGRVKDVTAIPALEGRADLKLGRFTVERVSLIQSTLTRSGPIYTCLQDFPLAGHGEVEGWEEKGLD
ncbi:MAG: RNA 2',3'-cyclic phosphodiesterase [Limnochordia bacterium]